MGERVTELILRLALFTALPVLLGAAIVVFDKSAAGPVRRSEAFLIPLFLVGLGGSGVSEFISQLFISEPAAPAAGESGHALQVQAGFGHLAIGLLGAVAAQRRDGFREAAVAAAAVFGLGVAYAAFIGVMETDNFAAGAALKSVAALVTPALLIWFLIALRRAEHVEPPTIVITSWMIPLRRGSVFAVAAAAMALPIGHATGQPVAASLAAIAVSAVAFWWIASRASSHRAPAPAGVERNR